MSVWPEQLMLKQVFISLEKCMSFPDRVHGVQNDSHLGQMSQRIDIIFVLQKAGVKIDGQ